MKKCLMLICFMHILSISYAQAPLQFNYQGVARDVNGVAIANKTIGLRFSIHTVSPTGKVEYSEQRSATTDSKGLFNVAIGGPGATNITDSFANITWYDGSKFLQVELDISNNKNFINMGTAQLLSVPYSLYSNNSAYAYNSFNSSYSGVSVHSDTSKYTINSDTSKYSINSINSLSSGSYFFDTYFNGDKDSIILDKLGWNTIIFNTKSFDDSNVYNTQTGEFTAKDSGIYNFSVSIYIRDAIDELYAGILKNGVVVKYFSFHETNNFWHRGQFSYNGIIRLKAGDIITIGVYMDENIHKSCSFNSSCPIFGGTSIADPLDSPALNSESVNYFDGYKIK